MVELSWVDCSKALYTAMKAQLPTVNTLVIVVFRKAVHEDPN
jgi:hypothetical protein